MANVVKYTTGSENLAIKKGNFYIGVGDVDKGPTASTGFWNGIDPPTSGYTIYISRTTTDPSIFVANTDNDLINLTNQISGQNYTGVTQCLVYFASQSDKMVLNVNYPLTITDGMVLNLDAGFAPSYPRSGITWSDISLGEHNGTLTNGPTYSSDGGGSIVFDGVDDYVTVPSSTNIGNPNTICALIKLSGTNSDTVIYGPDANGGDNWFGINTNRLFLFFTETADVNNFTIAGTTTFDTTNSRWYFVTSTISGSVASIYVNAVQENTTTRNFTIGSWSGGASVGRRGNINQRYFIGSVAYIMGYNRVLSIKEIQQNLYQSNIVTEDLVFHVDANNIVSYVSGLTTVFNLAGSATGIFGGNTGNAVGGAPSFNSGGYWTFDSSSQQNISFGDNFDLTTTNISGFVWGWVESATAQLPWIDKLSSGGNYRLHTSATGQIIFGIRDGANVYQQMISNTGVVEFQKWNCIGFTFNNNTRTGKTYINGNLVQTSVFTIDRGNTSEVLRIGYQTNNGFGLNGRIATVSLYQKELTLNEIQQNYNATKSRFGL